MRLTHLRPYQGFILGISMLITVLLASACAGVPTSSTTTGTSNTPGTTTATSATTGSTPGANQPTATPQTTTAWVPGSIQFTGTVSSVTPSTIIVQMPDGPLTMSITPQTDRSHFNGGLPTNGQPVNVTAIVSNNSFLANKLEPADQKDQTKQNTVQYQGVTTSTVGADNILHLSVGDKTWNFTINQSTDLGHFNSAQSIQANQTLNVKVQFNGTSGIVLKVDADNGN